MTETIGAKLDALRKMAGMSMDQFAKAAGFSGQSSVQRYLHSDFNEQLRPALADKFVAAIEPALTRTHQMARNEILRFLYSDGFGGSTVQPGPVAPQPNATVLPGAVDMGSTHMLPVYGQAIAGPDGEFVMNGEKIMDILAPPMLQNVKGAYAVMISGESMEPRYFAGETAYVHPRMAVRRDDFVVVQIAPPVEGDPPHAYVKQFLRQNVDELMLRQLNPREDMSFDAAKVVSVHKIVMSGIS